MKIKRLGGVAVRKFRNGDRWDMSNTPALYWAGANYSELSAVPAREIATAADRLGGAASKMKDGLLPLIYNKVRMNSILVSC